MIRRPLTQRLQTHAARILVRHCADIQLHRPQLQRKQRQHHQWSIGGKRVTWRRKVGDCHHEDGEVTWRRGKERGSPGGGEGVSWMRRGEGHLEKEDGRQSPGGGEGHCGMRMSDWGLRTGTHLPGTHTHVTRYGPWTLQDGTPTPRTDQRAGSFSCRSGKSCGKRLLPAPAPPSPSSRR